MGVLWKIHVLVFREIRGFQQKALGHLDLLVRFYLVCALVGEFTSIETTCPSLHC